MTTKVRGKLTYDSYFGHVCTCTARETKLTFAGFEGEQGEHDWTTYEPTVGVDRSIPPTDSGSWYYVCSRCGAGGWSGEIVRATGRRRA